MLPLDVEGGFQLRCFRWNQARFLARIILLLNATLTSSLRSGMEAARTFATASSFSLYLSALLTVERLGPGVVMRVFRYINNTGFVIDLLLPVHSHKRRTTAPGFIPA